LLHSKDILGVQRVHSVRKIRLERALQSAQRATALAEAELFVAAQKKCEQSKQLCTARDEVRQNPVCEQTLLWRGLCAERLVEAEGYVINSREQLDRTKIELAEQVWSLRNHEIRADQINTYSSTLRRQEARHAEILGEDEVLPAQNGVQP
jgi:hypothetical protein